MGASCCKQMCLKEGKKNFKKYNLAITRRMCQQTQKARTQPAWLCSAGPTLSSFNVITSCHGSRARSEVGRQRKQKEDLEHSRKPEPLFYMVM